MDTSEVSFHNRILVHSVAFTKPTVAMTYRYFKVFYRCFTPVKKVKLFRFSTAVLVAVLFNFSVKFGVQTMATPLDCIIQVRPS